MGAVFVHIPKTAGNYFQSFLLANNLSASTQIGGFGRDGYHRFELQDSLTRHKHQRLREYQDSLFSSGLNFISIYRNPSLRLLSLYMSPHRNSRLYLKRTPLRVPFFFSRFPSLPFDHRELSVKLPTAKSFRAFIQNQPSSMDFLHPNSRSENQTLRLLDFENLSFSVEALLQQKNISASTSSSEKLNVGPELTRDLPEGYLEMLNDVVDSSHHVRDFKLKSLLNSDVLLSDFLKHVS